MTFCFLASAGEAAEDVRKSAVNGSEGYQFCTIYLSNSLALYIAGLSSHIF
jgi:hypothetical protein